MMEKPIEDGIKRTIKSMNVKINIYKRMNSTA